MHARNARRRVCSREPHGGHPNIIATCPPNTGVRAQALPAGLRARTCTRWAASSACAAAHRTRPGGPTAPAPAAPPAQTRAAACPPGSPADAPAAACKTLVSLYTLRRAKAPAFCGCNERGTTRRSQPGLSVASLEGARTSQAAGRCAVDTAREDVRRSAPACTAARGSPGTRGSAQSGTAARWPPPA